MSSEARKYTSRLTVSALTARVAGATALGLSTQSAMKMLVSCSTLALRLLAQTSFVPSGLSVASAL